MTMPLTLLGLMLATFIVLITGVILMAIGGKANKKYGNKLMIARVTLQAAAIVLLALTYLMYHGSH